MMRSKAKEMIFVPFSTLWMRPINLFRSSETRAQSQHTSFWGLRRLSHSQSAPVQNNVATNITQRIISGQISLKGLLLASIRDREVINFSPEVKAQVIRHLIEAKYPEEECVGLLHTMGFNARLGSPAGNILIATAKSEKASAKFISEIIPQVFWPSKKVVDKPEHSIPGSSRAITDEDICSGADPAYVSSIWDPNYGDTIVPAVSHLEYRKSDAKELRSILDAHSAEKARAIILHLKTNNRVRPLVDLLSQ